MKTDFSPNSIASRKIKWGEHEICLESGRIARQSDGAVFVTSGKTSILCTVVADENIEIDYLGLSVAYQEKFYAANKIPGGYIKREGKPGDGEILTSRVIDRSLRPMFKDGFYASISLICTVMSYDENACPPEILSILASSAALRIAGLPLKENVIAVKIGCDRDELYFNRCVENGDLRMIASFNPNSITMVESFSNELSSDVLVEGIEKAAGHANEIFGELDSFIHDAIEAKKSCFLGSEVKDFHSKASAFVELRNKFFEVMKNSQKYIDVKESLGIAGKARINAILSKARRDFAELCVKPAASDMGAGEVAKDAEEIAKSLIFRNALDKIYSEMMSDKLFDESKRFDGRDAKAIRSITTSVGFLPKAHGSSLFTRGETQVIAVATIGGGSDAKMDNSILGVREENLMLHYNFHSFSVNEASPPRSTGRRELGHGSLALHAIKPLIHNAGKVVRIVGEVTESNGSSSMATVCASSLSIMSSRIKMDRHVAGIAMGLAEKNREFIILSDIDGNEDKFGCMDYKVAGTRKGITALQMDVKVDHGVTSDLLRKSMNQAKEGIAHILSIMEEASDGEDSSFILKMKIEPERKKDVLGYGGKILKEISRRSDSLINIDEIGNIEISANTKEDAEKAKLLVEGVLEGVNIGDVIEAVVKSKVDFGAFIQFGCAQEGLVHTSEGGQALNIGDKVKVRAIDINAAGKLSFSTDLDD